MNGFPRVFAGRRFAVVGLGRNGLAAAHALAAMGAEVTGWDDAPAARAGATGIAISDPVAADIAAEALVLSPGIPHRLPAPHRAALWARERGIPVVSDAELLFRAVRAAGSAARFVGVTGTNGKSTTTALLAHILAGAGLAHAAGGNLGPAALALPLLDDHGIYVLEMSSYMLERLADLRFHAAAMLNLSPDHLDRHGDMAGYAAAKRQIFARQRAGDAAVIGVDDEAARAMAAVLGGGPAHRVRISGRSPADIWCERGVLRDGAGPILAMAAAPALPGEHNAQNAAAAAALAWALGLGRAAIAQGIRSFPGLPHRLAKVGEIGGIAFIDDSKATNAEAAARALSCYPRLVWIAGGIAKAGGIESLVPYFPRISEAILIGRDAGILAATLSAHGVAHRILGTIEAAVPAAEAAARARGVAVVLLSPAGASFDQFASFEARGDRFASLVAALAAGRAA